MHMLLITLVGPQRTLDLQLPGEVPISEMMPAFVKMCGYSHNAQVTNPLDWSIGRKEHTALLNTNHSLLDAGITNGTTLVLCEKNPVDMEQTSPLRLLDFSPRTATTPTKTFYIPVRDYPPLLPKEEIVLSAPPQLPSKQSGVAVWLQLLLPVIGCMGGSLFFLMYFMNGLAGPNSQWILLIAIAVPLLSIVASVATNLVQRWTAKKQREYAREAYLEYLTAWQTRLHETTELQQQVSARLYPTLPTLAKNVIEQKNEYKYLWERRPEEEDFLRISVGRGPVPLCSHISLGLNPDPMIKYEPELRAKADSLIAQYHHLEDEPIDIPLRTTGVLAIIGKRAAAVALVRAMVCQIVTFHAPTDVRCVACFPRNVSSDWDWLKWLPHVQRLRHTKAERHQVAEQLCLLANTLTDWQELFKTQIQPELELRRKLSEDKREDAAKSMLPHLIFIIDGFSLGGELTRLPEMDKLFRDVTKLGVTILCIVDEAGREPAETKARIILSNSGWLTFEVTSFGGRRLTSIIPEATNVQTCDLIARSLALITPDGNRVEEDLAQDVRLLDLLNISAADTINSAKTWLPREREKILCVPLGKQEKGQALLLDLKEASENGHGPHGLVVGAIGSGKSELLRTLVIGQAILHDPSTVNFVFVDFKGGASFADLAALPHVAGMITNLENQPALIDRMHASLSGELRRRQRMLREAGNLDKIQQYQEKWYGSQHTLEPMPHLLIIVDEFAELLANRPDFLDLFVTIGRLGRSLGLHLLLATQRLEEGRLKGLESYLSYRICLRTFSASESSAVLGKPDAYYLPSAPGVGYLKIGANPAVRFKTALITMPYRPATQQITVSDLIYTFTESGKLIPYQTKIHTRQAETDQTEMDGVIARLATPSPSKGNIFVHQVWLPPLPKSLKLEALLPGGFTGASWHRSPSPGILHIPLGLLDMPLDQAQTPLMLDFSGAGGHLAIVGAPQSGKSTLLRTFMMAFIVTHSPRDVQFYCIDLGGGQLRAFEAFPHVGAVCTKTDRERMRLLIRLMYRIIADREVVFHEHDIESMATYRMRRQAGELTEFPFGDVFLLIDNLAQLQHDFEQLEAEIANLVTIGLTYGVHLVVATNRWAELRPKLRDNIGTRLELRLNDPIETVVDKKEAAKLSDGVPGRGLTKDKLQFQTCLPWMSTDGGERIHPNASQQQILEALVERMRLWKGPIASPVLMLPTQLRQAEMVQAEKSKHPGVPIGLEEFRLEPVYIDLLSTGPHFLIFGDAECGKTNLLRLWVNELTKRYTSAQVRIAAIECRTTTNLLDITQSEHCLTYASMSMPSTLKESVECLVNTLKERTLTSHSSFKELALAKKWTGPQYFLFVDDYEAIAAPGGNDLSPLRNVIMQARDIGFHLILARSVSGASSMSFEPIFKSLRETGSPGLIMSGDRQEGKLLHEQAATNLPPGRGYLVQRKHPATQIQTALVECNKDSM